jgi:hypothetical protein
MEGSCPACGAGLSATTEAVASREIVSDRAEANWRRTVARLRGLFKLRRLWAHLGTHLKEYKGLRAK